MKLDGKFNKNTFKGTLTLNEIEYQNCEFSINSNQELKYTIKDKYYSLGRIITDDKLENIIICLYEKKNNISSFDYTTGTIICTPAKNRNEAINKYKLILKSIDI